MPTNTGKFLFNTYLFASGHVFSEPVLLDRRDIAMRCNPR